MDHHVGVLQQRVQPLTVLGREGQRLERARHERQQPREEDRDARQHRDDHRHELAVAVAVQAHAERREARQQPAPEHERARLAPPQGGDLERPGERAARVVRDVAQREGVAEQARPERGHRHRHEREQAVDGPLGAVHPGAASRPARAEGHHHRVGRRGQRQQEGRAPEDAHPARPPARPPSGAGVTSRPTPRPSGPRRPRWPPWPGTWTGRAWSGRCARPRRCRSRACR